MAEIFGRHQAIRSEVLGVRARLACFDRAAARQQITEGSRSEHFGHASIQRRGLRRPTDKLLQVARGAFALRDHSFEGLNQ